MPTPGTVATADRVGPVSRRRPRAPSRCVGWVVGADGGHSTTRTLLGTALEGDFHGQHFAMADVDVDTTLSRDTMRMFTHPDGMGIFFPLAGERARTNMITSSCATRARSRCGALTKS
jgi:2-polyprenyl-6-methoxyphenol hydroxylase-like FAD-dependent oxidoreductase